MLFRSQEYYEGAYERLIGKDVAFHALDITDLKWTEVDTRQDFDTAERIFSVIEPEHPPVESLLFTNRENVGL